MTIPTYQEARERVEEPMRKLEQDTACGVWRGCRPAFVRDDKIEGFPSFSMADLHEISAALPVLLAGPPEPTEEEVARALFRAEFTGPEWGDLNWPRDVHPTDRDRIMRDARAVLALWSRNDG